MKSVNKLLLPNSESYHNINFYLTWRYKIKCNIPSSAAGLAYLEHPDWKDPHLM
jgi:hypothetical protein